MPVQFFSSFLPTAEDVLKADLPRLSRILLIIVNSWEGSGTVYQSAGGINREYCIAMMEARNIGLGPLLQNQPEYGARQPEVTKRVREAFHWLETNGYLLPTPNQLAIGWVSFTDAGKELLSKAIRFEQWEKLGLEAVKHGLSPQVREWAAEWTRLKESQNTTTNAKQKTARETIQSPSRAGFLFTEFGSPTALISYSWDSPENQRWVEELARRLRGDGVTIILDRWHLKPGDDKFVFSLWRELSTRPTSC